MHLSGFYTQEQTLLPLRQQWHCAIRQVCWQRSASPLLRTHRAHACSWHQFSQVRSVSRCGSNGFCSHLSPCTHTTSGNNSPKAGNDSKNASGRTCMPPMGYEQMGTMKGETAHRPVVCNKEILMKSERKQGRCFHLFSPSPLAVRHAWTPQRCVAQGGVLTLSSLR